MMLCGVICGYAQNTPPFSASTETWTFGDQTWSDAIQISECNKTSFTNTPTNPQCRNYTYEGKTFYYYNWAYVNTNAIILCPSPWRVPTEADFKTLVADLRGNTNVKSKIAAVRAAWGTGGFAYDGYDILSETTANYWSSTETGRRGASQLYIWSSETNETFQNKDCGMQVRCVK